MDFLQQEVNICYPDGIRLTQFIMLMYHKSVCQSLRKLKDKYTVVLTSYLHTFMNYQKMNCCLKTNIILFKVEMLQKLLSRWISVQDWANLVQFRKKHLLLDIVQTQPLFFLVLKKQSKLTLFHKKVCDNSR